MDQSWGARPARFTTVKVLRVGSFSITPVVADDVGFLREMLYEAAFWRRRSIASRPPMDEAMERPDLAVYLRDWGRPGDRGQVAWHDAERLGAAWFRLFSEAEHGYGYVDARTPELSIGVMRARRGKGVGRALLVALLAQAAIDGYEWVSLSVEIDNPARRLYDRLDFEPVEQVDGALTMVADVGA